MSILAKSLEMEVVHVLKFVAVVSCIMSKHSVAIVEDDECTVTRCHRRGSEIRFPFRMNSKDKNEQVQSHHFGSPAAPFQLSCLADYPDDFAMSNRDPFYYDHRVFHYHFFYYQEHQGYSHKYSDYPIVEFKYQVNTSFPGLHLSFTVKAYVHCINYKMRQLHFIYKSTKITKQYDQYVPADSPFLPFTLKKYQVDNAQNLTDYTFYKCRPHTTPYPYPLKDVFEKVPSLDGGPSLDGSDYSVYAIYSHLTTTEADLRSCTKLYNISDVPFLGGGLSWSGPDCLNCEDKRQYCKFKAKNTTLTECFPIPKGHTSNKILVAGIIILPVILVAICYAIYLYKQKEKYQQKIEMFLEDYKALKPTRYSFADIKKISNHFKVKLGEGGYGSVFKGQLSNDVAVAVKILNDKADAKGSGEDFINEVSTIGLIHHVNVVRLVGYCADGCRRALVYEFLPNNSLEKYVYSRENSRNRFLGWEKMEEIALGIAKGIEYLHQGCAQRILHFDIKPHNILLDQNFNPKISDFGLAKLCTKGQSIVSMTMARGTVGYIAPEVFSRNFGKVSSKSDVYSFGMLLLEMVGARTHTSIAIENTSEVYFPEWIFHQLEQETETTSQIEEDGNSKIKRKLTIVGLWCVNWHPADRPSMKHVIQMLEGEDCPAIPPNPFSSTSSRTAFAASSARPFANELEAISESE